ncbi:DUF374 domain-containing protein [bacterium]|nr:DUF374 domain-containing protein [bacterium]
MAAGLYRARLKAYRRRITYSDRFLTLLSGLIVFLIRCYLPLLRIRMVYHPAFIALDRTKAFYGFWHGRLLLLAPVFGKWKITIMTDLSWAGGLLARILARFGYTVVRGSSKRQGFEGIIRMKKAVEQGTGGALAVDGPHGPGFRSKPGILYLARKLGYPVVPLTFGCSRYWTLRTWDRVIVPKPFSRCLLALGEPHAPGRFRGDADTETLDQILMQWSNQIDNRARRGT